jgi:hypothetical protein
LWCFPDGFARASWVGRRKQSERRPTQDAWWFTSRCSIRLGFIDAHRPTSDTLAYREEGGDAHGKARKGGSKKTGRQPKPLPPSIPDTAENIMKALVDTPLKKRKDSDYLKKNGA